MERYSQREKVILPILDIPDTVENLTLEISGNRLLFVTFAVDSVILLDLNPHDEITVEEGARCSSPSSGTESCLRGEPMKDFRVDVDRR